MCIPRNIVGVAPSQRRTSLFRDLRAPRPPFPLAFAPSLAIRSDSDRIFRIESKFRYRPARPEGPSVLLGLSFSPWFPRLRTNWNRPC